MKQKICPHDWKSLLLPVSTEPPAAFTRSLSFDLRSSPEPQQHRPLRANTSDRDQQKHRLLGNKTEIPISFIQMRRTNGFCLNSARTGRQFVPYKSCDKRILFLQSCEDPPGLLGTLDLLSGQLALGSSCGNDVRLRERMKASLCLLRVVHHFLTWTFVPDHDMWFTGSGYPDDGDDRPIVVSRG